jgi:hypothetical protein
MRYFTPELVAKANNWVEQSEAEWRSAQTQFWATADRYIWQLDGLKSRISRPAWKFFRYGYAETGLHDATLLTLSVGDAPGGAPGNLPSLSPMWRKAAARVELLNYEKSLHYTFGMRGLKHFSADMFPFPDQWNRGIIDDLNTYELTGAETGELEFGLLFVSGATAVFRFERLLFRRQRLKKLKTPLQRGPFA